MRTHFSSVPRVCSGGQQLFYGCCAIHLALDTLDAATLGREKKRRLSCFCVGVVAVQVAFLVMSCLDVIRCSTTRRATIVTTTNTPWTDFGPSVTLCSKRSSDGGVVTVVLSRALQ